MSFLAVTFLYPVLLGILSTGAGLLVERLAGIRLPSALIPAAGFAALLVLSQFTVLSPAVARLTPWVLAAVAVGGFALGRQSIRTRWSTRRSGWWLAPLAAVACYVTVALPLIAALRLTFPGFLLDTTAGFHLAAGEWMLHHGAPLPAPYPAYGAMLNVYYGHGYPTGGQVLLAATGWLSGQDLLWLYFPFQAGALSLAALVLTDLAGRAGLSRWAAAFTGWIAGAAALVTAYAQMGSIKELTALPMLLLMGVAILHAREHAQAGLRGAIVFALAGGAAVAAIGPAAAAWIGVFAVAGLLVASPVLTAPRARPRYHAARPYLVTLASAAATTVGLLVVFSIPTLTRLAAEVHAALSFSASNVAAANDPGNLVRPLRWVQAFGVWLGGSHRVDPRYLTETYALIGVAILAFALGVIWLVRRRSWAILALLAGSLVVWAVLTKRGTEWTDAKVLMLTSPVVVSIALIGALGDLRAHLLQSLLLAGAIGAGVLASDALLYHSTNLAPSARYRELLSIGQRFGGEGPTLVPDFDEYTFYALRKLNINGPGFAGDMTGPVPLVAGTQSYGHSYDVDGIEAPFVERFRLIAMRRSPRWSRPPGDFRLIWSGSYYDVWRRAGAMPRFHMPAGGGMQANSELSCHAIQSAATRAMSDGGSLRYASRALNVVANLARAAHSPSVVPVADLSGFPSVTFTAPGSISARVDVPVSSGYGLWLGGNVDRALPVLIDGHQVGAPSDQSGDDGNMIRVGSVPLAPGSHTIELMRGGGSIAPGDNAGVLLDGVYLQPVGVERETLATIRPQAWRSLCGRVIDWLEVT